MVINLFKKSRTSHLVLNSGVSKLDLAVAQVTVAVAPCVAWRAAPFITKNEK